MDKKSQSEFFNYSKNLWIIIISYLVVILPFFITRLPFFLHYPVPMFYRDYISYFKVADKLISGFFPLFTDRTPGYPVFIAAILFLFNKVISIIWIQNIFTLITSLFFVHIVYRCYPRLVLLSAIAVSAFISSSVHVLMDVSLMTESFFSNVSLLFFAFLILGLKRNKSLYLLFCSLLSTLAVLTRPSGIFFIPVLVLLAIFLLVNKYPKKAVFSLVLPALIILNMLAFYNLFTICKFTLSPRAERSFMCATCTFWEQDDSYSDEINKKIENVQARFAEEDIEALKTSWDLEKLRSVFHKYYGRKRLLKPMGFYTKPYMEIKPVLRKISLDAVLKHPVIYLKFVLSMLRQHFLVNISTDKDLYNEEMPNNYRRIYLEYTSNPKLKPLYKKMLGDYLNLSNYSNFEKDFDNRKISVSVLPAKSQNFHRFFKKIQNTLFRNIFWAWWLFIAFLYSFFVLARSRFRHRGAFIILTLTFVSIASGIVTCLVQRSHARYSFPLEFSNYLSFALFPLVVFPDDEEKVRFYLQVLKSKLKLFVKNPASFVFYVFFYFTSFVRKERDVTIISYPKSGRTWLERLLIETGKSVKNLEADKISAYKELFKRAPDLPNIRFSHACSSWEELNISCIYNDNEVDDININKYAKGKVIFLYRDPRDVLVSSYHHMKYRNGIAGLEGKDLINHKIVGLKKIIKFMNFMLRYVKDREDCMLVSYEDMKIDARAVLSDVCNFVKMKADQTTVSEAVSACEFNVMQKKEQKGEYKNPRLSPVNKNNVHSFKVRKGKVGGYSEFFSAEEIDLLNRIMKENIDPFFKYKY